MPVSSRARGFVAVLICLAVHVRPLGAQDTSFASLQRRGKVAMGVDQYSSVHRFDDLADGGRIRLERDRDDVSGTRAIQAHLKGIATAFASGNFDTPAFVHMQHVPGSADMARGRGVIRYTFRPLRRGGELRIITSDTSARRAIHEFLAFQRAEHHAAGSAMHDKSGQSVEP